MVLKNLKTTASLLLLLLPGIILSSCKKDSPVEIKKEEPVEVPDTSRSGKRDYEWKLDTLKMTMNNIASIWGSSPDDMWVVGPGGRAGEELWHYDGIKWTPSTKGSDNGYSLFGFSKNNIWMGCRNGLICHYTGSYWNMDYEFKIKGLYTSSITKIVGISENDIYASGYYVVNTTSGKESVRGILLHYNGYLWSEVYRGEEQTCITTSRIAGNKVYLIIAYIGDTNTYTTYKMLEYYNKQFKQIDIGSDNTRTLSTTVIGDRMYCWIGNKMYLVEDYTLKEKMVMDDPYYWTYSFGRSFNDMFITRRTELLHYNGTDMKTVYRSKDDQDLVYSAMFVMEKDVFIGLEGSNGENYILHGKLK